DRDVDETVAVPGKAFKTHVGFDMVEEGTFAAQYLVDHAQAKLGSAPYKVLEIEGTTGSSPQADRKKGFEDELAKHTGFTIVQDGEMDVTITCFPSLGPEVMDTYEQMEAGTSVPLLVKTKNVVCDKAAVDAAAKNTAESHEFCDGFGTIN